MTDISPGWQCNLFLEGSAGGQKWPRRLRDELKLFSNLKDGCSGNCCSLFSKQTFICYPFSLQILERPEPQAETGSYNPSQISQLPSFANIYSFGWWKQEACMKVTVGHPSTLVSKLPDDAWQLVTVLSNYSFIVFSFSPYSATCSCNSI